MIVRQVGGRIQLITQPDHARLARRVMDSCLSLSSRLRRDAILHAIEEHDNGWAEVDAAPTVDATIGRIADFVHAAVPLRQGVWPRGVVRLAHDPWAAALVAHHAIVVYDRFRADAEWTTFFADMQTRRDAMVRASGLSFEDLSADYPFLRLADLISLAFCTGWTDEQRYADWTVRLVGTRVVVSPDVFGGATVPIEVPARELSEQTFRSDTELRGALARAITVTLRGDVR